jgi:hypothetical protein
MRWLLMQGKILRNGPGVLRWQAYWKRPFFALNSDNTDKSESQPQWTRIKKLIRVYCQQCDMALCLGHCFKNYNSIINYWEWSCQVNLVHVIKSGWHLRFISYCIFICGKLFCCTSLKIYNHAIPYQVSVSALFFFVRNVRKAYTFVCQNFIFLHKNYKSYSFFNITQNFLVQVYLFKYPDWKC